MGKQLPLDYPLLLMGKLAMIKSLVFYQKKILSLKICGRL
jgi:hypothetical protein